MDKFLEQASISGQVMAIGLVVVFAALALLILLINVMSRVMQEKKAPAPVPAVQAPVAPAPAPAPAVEPGIDPEVLAVISAAIAAYDKTGKSLVVRAIRRKGSWNRAAREENVYRF